MLYDVRAIDPVAFGTVPLMLILVTAMAVYVPDRRASRVEPMRVLKVDGLRVGTKPFRLAEPSKGPLNIRSE